LTHAPLVHGLVLAHEPVQLAEAKPSWKASTALGRTSTSFAMRAPVTFAFCSTRIVPFAARNSPTTCA
jgi:hypothetical protein